MDNELRNLKKEFKNYEEEISVLRKSLQDEKSGNKELNSIINSLENNLR